MGVFSNSGNVYVFWLWLALVSLLWPLLPAITVAATTRQSAPVSDSPPLAITARTALDPGWQFPLVNVRQPVTYRLHIEHDAQILVVPESVTPEALRRALVGRPRSCQNCLILPRRSGERKRFRMNGCGIR
jgi:hypothetical protein